MGQVEQTRRCNKQTPKNSQSCDGPIEELHEPLPCCRSAVLIGLLFFLETRSKLYEPFQQNLRRPPLGQDCGRNFLVDDEFLIKSTRLLTAASKWLLAMTFHTQKIPPKLPKNLVTCSIPFPVLCWTHNVGSMRAGGPGSFWPMNFNN